ncbi:MAG: InlB B-repeat-containing protein, partial [Oscillospiraceae bacterium]|nr:InlB B-repeat-containing protein [Oscillospiraceae bacterium]
ADPSADGYTFGGWFKDEALTTAWSFETDTVTENTTIFAKWTVNSYTVTFEMNGHGEAIASQAIEHGNAVTKPADPSADGYTFGGWFKDEALTTAWNFEADTVTENTTIYAKWTEIPSVTELDDPTAEELTAALEAAAQSDYITEVFVTNAAISMDTMTVCEGDTLTIDSGSLGLNGETTISGTLNISGDAILVNTGTMNILSSESLHISGHFTNNADLMIGSAGSAGAVFVEEGGKLESTGKIVIDLDTGSTLTNNGTIVNSGEFSVTVAGQFINNGSYEENRDVIVAMSVSDTSVSYLMPLSEMTEWPSEPITLIGAESETLDIALPAIESVDVILDLNGRTITMSSSAIEIAEGASLTLRDNSDGASGKIVSSYSSAINNYGTFTLESGAVDSLSSAAIQLNSDSSTYIHGGTVTGSSYGIYGGTTTNTINTLTVTGGYISGANYGIYTAYSQGPVLISGGEIISDGVVLYGNGAYDEAANTGTRISGTAILRVTGENTDTAAPSLISGGATIEGGMLYAKDPTIFDALQMQLPQETGPDEDGYYCVDMSADPTAWTLTSPDEAALQRALAKDYIETLVVIDADIILSSIANIQCDKLTLTSSTLTVSADANLNLYGEILIESGSTLNNSGAITMNTAGSPLITNNGTFINSGAFSVNSGGLFVNNGDFTDNRSDAVYALSCAGSNVNYLGKFSDLPAWYDGDTVTLHGLDTLATFPEALATVSGVSVTLDLNGRRLEMPTITGSEAAYGTTLSIAPGASFTLTDSSVNKTGSLTCSNSTAILNEGTFVLDGGNITSNDSYTISNTGSFTMVSGSVENTGGETAVANNGTLTMEDGSITNSNTDGCAIYTQPYSTTTINGGTVSGGTYGLSIKGMSGDSSVIIINGGTISGSSAGIDKIGGGGSLTITAGKITSDDTAVKAGSAEVYISGGTFDGKNAALYASSNTTITGGIFTSGAAAVIAESSYGVLNISGGTFEGTNAALSISEPTTKAIITGGTFTSDSTVIIANGAYDEYENLEYGNTYVGGTLITGSTTLRLTAAEDVSGASALISGDASLEGGTLQAKSTEFFTLLKLEASDATGPDAEGYYTLTIATSVADVSTLDAFVEALNNRTHTIHVTNANWTLSATETTSVLTIPESVTVNLNSGSIVIDEGYELYVYGTLNMAAGTSIINNGTIEIGGSSYPNAELVNNGEIENNGIYLDNRYRNASNTSNSYLVVDVTDDSGWQNTVYCGAPEGANWDLFEGSEWYITYHSFSKDDPPLYIPDSFTGTTDIPFSLYINTQSHAPVPNTVVITTQSGQLTTAYTHLCFNNDTDTSSGVPSLQFNGHINLEICSSLEATDTSFTGIDESLAVITANGTETISDYTVWLKGCTITQNSTASALDLTNASVRLESLYNNTGTQITPTTITSGGTGIFLGVADGTSLLDAENIVVSANGTGLDITALATVSLSGCTVSSEGGTGIKNLGDLTLYGGCTVSGATYALYNESSVTSDVIEDSDTGEMLYNTFILTSADGAYTVFSEIEEGSDTLVSLRGTFKAKNADQIFSDQLKQETDEVTEEYSADQSTILYYVIWRE